MSRVVIIGGGVMGMATALELRDREVVLLERAVPGAEASSAAAGMLAAQVESKNAEERAMFVRAREAYAAWSADLRERTGLDIGYRKSGVLELAATEQALGQLERRAASDRAAGLRAEIVSELAPAVGAGALWMPDEAQVDPPLLLRALVAAVAKTRVVVRSGSTVTSLVIEKDRCVGVEVDGAERILADHVVLAAGSWSSLVPGAKVAVRVRPIRGQLVQLEERPPVLEHIVFHANGYLVPRGDGRVICGSTMEDVGHDRAATAAGVQSILNGALAAVPGLGRAEVTRTWCNFRPYSEAGPQVGKSTMPGLILATGHHRNGILLAKMTAEAVAASL